MSEIGHNKGPTMEAGHGFRRHAWARARKVLLPAMPLEVVRLRVRRAKALGLPYKTYASIRATTGQDIVAFLFSTNALNVLRRTDTIPADRAAQLAQIQRCGRHLSVAPGLDPHAFPGFDSTRNTPPFTTSWTGLREDLADFLNTHGLPGDTVVMIGETAFEREYANAGRLAGFVTGQDYFGGAA